jgi:hypothetical protein
MRMPGYTAEFSLYTTGAHFTVATKVPSNSQVIASTIYVTGPGSKWSFTCWDAKDACDYGCLQLPDNKNNKKIDCLTCCGQKWNTCHYKSNNSNWGIWWPYNSPPCNEPPYTYSGV